jgi:hypothetical protein
VSATWANWPGAPGISQFYLSGPSPTQAQVDGVRAFFFALASFFPTGLTVQVQASGDSIIQETGVIDAGWSVGTTPAVVTGAGTGSYAGNAGMVVHWLTNYVVGRRRLRGRTFLVPCAQAAYDSQGSLAASTIVTLTNAANTLVTAGAGQLMVWHRPKLGVGGTAAPITAVRVPDLAVQLKSRRI